jgi:hypothetical protein
MVATQIFLHSCDIFRTIDAVARVITNRARAIIVTPSTPQERVFASKLPLIFTRFRVAAQGSTNQGRPRTPGFSFLLWIPMPDGSERRAF